MTLAVVAAGWLAGVVAAALGLQHLWLWPALTTAAASLALMLGGRSGQALLLGAALLAALAGLARYESAKPSPAGSLLARVNEERAVLLRGLVDAEPEERERSQRLRVRVSAIDDGSGWQPASDRVLVTARPFPRYAFGDRLELAGQLRTPPSLPGFDYREYLLRQGVVSLMPFPSITRVASGGGHPAERALVQARGTLGANLSRSLPEPEAALARGILLGQRASIPRDLMEDFNSSGTSHLIAISGFNVMLVAGLTASSLAWLLGRRAATIWAMAAVVLFALFVGGSGSVLRAAVMGLVMLGARLSGRPGSALASVLLAAAALTAWRPTIIDDAGFQLSVAATLGIVLGERRTEEVILRLGRLTPGSGPALLAEPVAVTLSATAAVLPLTLASFGYLPVYTLPANLLAVPAYVVALAASCLTALVGLASADAARILGSVAYLPLAYMIAVARTTASLPLSTLRPGSIGVEGAALIYALLSLLTLLLARRRTPAAVGRPGPRPPLVAATVIAGLALFVWVDLLSPAPGDLRVSVLDVGQGDAILIEAPSGLRVLVDGGPSGPRLLQALGEVLPAAERRIDLVVLTHAHDDHVTGLVDLVERYQVKLALAAAPVSPSAAYEAWERALERRAVPVRPPAAGEWLDLGGGARLEVLHPAATPISGGDEVNNNSIVLRLTHGRLAFLLTGDLEAEGERWLLQEWGDLRAQVLKVAHHGSDSSSREEFLAAVRPSLAVISVGDSNPYGHPSPTALLRLVDLHLLRTDVNGSVRLRSDGRRLAVDFQRGSPRVIDSAFLD